MQASHALGSALDDQYPAPGRGGLQFPPFPGENPLQASSTKRKSGLKSRRRDWPRRDYSSLPMAATLRPRGTSWTFPSTSSHPCPPTTVLCAVMLCS
ncbi:hypothetical protein AB1Y20_002914 [Prymnesium parvum]|uniref:Uncharacterized protein n=1 Tax=Prymnesium parvum TaxID=97485 RepID=A0AB34JCR1_PRYPA